jgi:hypothetical protein
MNDYEITIEMLKTRCHQHQAEEKRLKEEIYEFDPLTGGLSEKKKLDVANKKLLDFYQTMTEDQQQTLAFKKNCEDASPIDHQDIIAWMTQLLKERDEFEEENEELKEERDHYKKDSEYWYCRSETAGTMIEDAKDKQVIINKLKERICKLERATERALLVCDGSWSVFSSDEEDE